MTESHSGEQTMVIGTSSDFRFVILQKYFTSVFQSFVKLSPDIDEKALRSSCPFALTELIARAKMEAVLCKLKDIQPGVEHGVVITFDQVVVKDGEIREKPTSEEENRKFLLSYSGSSVATVSAYVVYSLNTGKMAVGHEETETFFSAYDRDVIDSVIARGVSLRTAGGFVVEDEDLSRYVVRNVGTLEAVRGVEPTTIARLLKQVELCV